MDRLLGLLVTWARRRGRAGEPVWLAVAATAWLVRRSRRRRDDVVWSGKLRPGQRLVVAVSDAGHPSPGVESGE